MSRINTSLALCASLSLLLGACGKSKPAAPTQRDAAITPSQSQHVAPRTQPQAAVEFKTPETDELDEELDEELDAPEPAESEPAESEPVDDPAEEDTAPAQADADEPDDEEVIVDEDEDEDEDDEPEDEDEEPDEGDAPSDEE